MASQSLDSLLDAALARSGPSSAQDMLILAVHASLLSSGYECIAIGDEVCQVRVLILLCQHF
jgi:hypothetical protein